MRLVNTHGVDGAVYGSRLTWICPRQPNGGKYEGCDWVLASGPLTFAFAPTYSKQGSLR